MEQRYPLPWSVLLRLGAAALTGKQRSFRSDALASVRLLTPPLLLRGEENIPLTGPCLVTINHYARPGFRAWWLAMAVSAALPVDVHWVVTSAWTFPGRIWAPLFKPVTHTIFRRLAHVYRFTSMPPMPPQPADTTARALAVRKVLAHARMADRPVIGLAPEGRDFSGGDLGQPPPGVGRFMLHLSMLGLPVLPVGAFEGDGRFCLRFGPVYRLEVPQGLPPQERDRQAGHIVMTKIAELLPQRLRGNY